MISTFDLVTCALRLFCCLKYSEHPQLTCKAAPGRCIMIHLDINGIDVLHQLALPRDVLNKQNHLKYLESPENFWTKPSGTFENISVNYLHGQHFYDLRWPTGGKYRYNFPEYLNHFWNRRSGHYHVCYQPPLCSTLALVVQLFAPGRVNLVTMIDRWFVGKWMNMTYSICT